MPLATISPPQMGRGVLNNATPTFSKGQWTNITPPGLGLQAHTFPSYGCIWVEVAPSNPKIIYTCVDTKGLYRSTDGGFSWAGPIGPADGPFAIRVDPSDPNHAYMTQGVRGATLGFWVTTDGGVTWTMPAGFTSICSTVGNFQDVTYFDVCPNDFNNIILSSHQAWTGFSNGGILHSTDGGSTWSAINPAWASAASTTPPHFLLDVPSSQGNANTWLVGTDGDGMWRTTNAGSSWTKVSTISIPHGGGDLYYASTGKIYIGSAGTPQVSADNGATWSTPSNLSSFYYYSVRGDGTTLYTALAYTGDAGGQADPSYYTSAETDGATWTIQNGGAQTFTDGPFNQVWVPSTKRLYSANWAAGLFVLQL